MDPTTVTTMVDFIQKISGAGFGMMLAVILWGGYKQIWVWGYQLKKIQEESDQWKALALQATGLVEKSVNKLNGH